MIDRSFWRGRKVLLTGHTGFKGSWLSLWLDALGADVTGYALAPPTEPNLFEQAKIARRIRSIQGDIRDFGNLKGAIAECRPEVIIHMAAQSVVGRGYEDPLETYSSNVMGTVHVLEGVRQLGRPCVIVNVTSDKCYANQEWLWGYRETDTLGGRDPYSSSKACAELITSAYGASFFSTNSCTRQGVALASARAGNVIGGGDWTSYQLVPDLMRAFMAGLPCQIRNPSAVRPWQFVLEPLHGYLLVCERIAKDGLGFASAWNFGPAEDDAKPVSWIANELAFAWGHGAMWTCDQEPRFHEAQLLKLDTSKARRLLDWHPVLPLRDSLGWVVEWYRAVRDGKDLESVTSSQIERYEHILQNEKPETVTFAPAAAGCRARLASA
jgi:CDP-glucose 4,6-dehydratase